MHTPPAGKKYKCKRCGKSWRSRKAERPTCCAKCKTAYWDRDPVLPERDRGAALSRD